MWAKHRAKETARKGAARELIEKRLYLAVGIFIAILALGFVAIKFMH